MRRVLLLLGVLWAVVALAAAPAYAAGQSATTDPPTNVGQTSATLNGTVNPGTDALDIVQSCTFNYGTTTAYGKTASCTPTPSGSGDQAVSATVTGLTPGMTYHYDVSISVLSVSLTSPGVITKTGSDVSFATQSPSGATKPVAVTAAATNVFSNSAQLNGTVTAGSADVTDCHFAYGTSASALTSTAPCSTKPTAGQSNVAVSAVVGGLSPSTTYTFELVATSSAGTGTGSPLTFTTAAPGNNAPAPTATTQPATSVGQTTATLNGTVNTKGLPATQCVFEYGPTTAYGATAPCTPTPTASSSDQNVHADLTNLSSGTQYHFRVDILTQGGPAEGNDATFTTTGASATTLPATFITGSSANLHGSVNPNGQTITQCAFVIGTSTAYGTTIPCAQSASSLTGTTPIIVSAAASGLQQKTTYHYQLIVTTAAAASLGGDKTFTTLALPTGTTQPATGVGTSTATLHGTVNPQGAPVIACYFQYGVAPFTYGTGGSSYPLAVKCNPTPSGSANTAVSAHLTGLASRTTYYYRVLVSTQAGLFVGNTVSFKTKSPVVKKHKKKKKKVPGVRITKTLTSRTLHGAKFYFRATHYRATRGFQCALVARKHGRFAKPHYRRCVSPTYYIHLRDVRYRFYVRAGDRAGWGRPATRTFTG
jgi:hypothetical protein